MNKQVIQNASGNVVVDFSQGDFCVIEQVDDIALDLTGATDGQAVAIRITQPGQNGGTVTWPSNVHPANANPAQLLAGPMSQGLHWCSQLLFDEGNFYLWGAAYTG
jgi:hypothetical protein